ncbi:MAG: GH3 auxin-responsive promoter family protein [Oscillospiraceae bacterium]|nr:GH3 auxin-responsive promoter family protein [Oscillospiraceae bacterium]
MNYGQRVQKNQKNEIWYEYCNFLGLSIDEYMRIQYRLFEEQISAWLKSGIAKEIIPGSFTQNMTVDEFRKKCPLTDYYNYADILLAKRSDMLPAEPVIWLQTTWEGGKHQIKLAPYTAAMLEVFKNNLMSVSTISSADSNKRTRLKNGDRVLFGLAPLPYVTGLFPHVFKEEIEFNFLPPVSEALKMSFGERNRLGFKMGMQKGIDVFFGMSSVIHYVTVNFSSMLKSGSTGSGLLKKITKMSPKMLFRFIHAKYISQKESRDIKPRDLFSLKSLVCAGTDTASYKSFLADEWGVKPLEIFAGTEPSIIGTETPARNGMVFFPDTCFYEFIPEAEVYKNIDDKSYEPRTVLLNELCEGGIYELVISVLKGGAFMRYRVGDMFRCVGSSGDPDTSLPRLVYIDRVPDVIDIAGFTRITEASISDVIRLSGVAVSDWTAKKEYDSQKRPFMHLYAEIDESRLAAIAVSAGLLKEHLETYFKYFDTDYHDLKKMLGIEPLQITIIKCGTFEKYTEYRRKPIRRINPASLDISDLLEFEKLGSNDTGRKGGG